VVFTLIPSASCDFNLISSNFFLLPVLRTGLRPNRGRNLRFVPILAVDAHFSKLAFQANVWPAARQGLFKIPRR
jgi:hypothetical protein